MTSEQETPQVFDIARFFDFARNVGHGRALGLQFCASGDNWAELCLPWREQLVGVPESGFLASGAIISLIDTTSGASVWATLKKFVPSVTLDLRLDYLRPALKGETIYARCECVKITRRVAFIRGVAHAGNPDKTIAHSSATFMLNR
ncbi:MAG TPA: PaaI family thioesterase [Sphingomicrobium sp.]|jgi:uncharacterized protein (TIGR00369 family)|nr:PaaI family thioesterase [Sphingomicrobium sp.]